MLQAVQKVVILFFGLLLLSTNLFSKPLFSNEQLSKLANSSQWRRLLHFKNGESEIDDKRFFFSKEGKRNPKSELKAFISKLASDRSNDENSTLCYYPSRSTWILQQLPQLKKSIFIPQCKKLKKEIKEIGAKKITIILASAHMNSPASAFGHTFLRIDNNSNTPLLSYAVNYAAQTNENNGFIYAYQGLFGGYEGRYSITPYYKKLKEYSDLEQRDIWEYTLDLTQEEIDRLILHILEIRHFYADYFFLAENCSYNLLWLIEVAKKKSNLVKQFNYKAIPIDTLRAINNENLIKDSIYRPSKRKEILAISHPIEHNPIALTFAKSNEYNLSLITELNTKEKIASLELATEMLKIKRSNNEIPKKEYLSNFLKILKMRSTLGKKDKEKIAQPASPQEGHLSAKTTFSYLTDKRVQLRTKVSYHDIYDNDNGYIPGAYISFFDTAIEVESNNIKLEELNLLDIKSYAIQDTIFKPISWEVSLGGKRVFNNELYSYLKTGAGVTLGRDTFYGYTTLTPTIYYKKNSYHSIALNSGILYNPSKDLKFGLTASKEWFNHKKEIKSLEPFFTYSFNQKSALNLKYSYKNIDKLEEKKTLISWFWYY